MARVLPRMKLDIRVSVDGLQAIDERAAQESVSRSELVRRLIRYAMANMPKGWTG